MRQPVAIAPLVLLLLACGDETVRDGSRGTEPTSDASVGSGGDAAIDEPLPVPTSTATGGRPGTNDAAVAGPEPTLDAAICSNDGGRRPLEASADSSGAVGGGGPSCNGLAPTCGPSGNEDCCASTIVPCGAFYRSYDGVTYTDRSNPATVSEFRLDKYEVTVGRFRKFVEAYRQDMIPEGAGKNPNDPNDPGWSAEWNVEPILAADAAELTSQRWGGVDCAGSLATELGQTWTATPGANESKPITCLTWFVAYAFCIWDGGRLPTEAEWNYAAAGGSEQRVYPWSSPPGDSTYDDSYAVYCGSSCSPQNVGLRSPMGDGRWGQSDMVGNITEWILDWYAAQYPNPCVNCTNWTPDVEYFYGLPSRGGGIAEITRRVIRGGSFGRAAAIVVSARQGFEPRGEGSTQQGVRYGARCARAP